MSPRRSDAEELWRWAQERAPGLLEQAEREAVRVLRDSLVKAALGAQPASRSRGGGRTGGARSGGGGGPTPPAPTIPPSRRDPEAGELLWVYCVLRATDPCPTDLPGVEPAGTVEKLEAAGLAALISPVPSREFGEEPLRHNLNDLGWLERVARRHEAVLEQAIQTSTVVPLRMCTLYETAQGVRGMLEREHSALSSTLAVLEGRLEWAVKVTVDPQRLLERARGASGVASETGPVAQGEGSVYMAHRRTERQARDLADSMASEVAERVHARLQDWAIDAVTRPPQNRELSGHRGEMVLNAAYLVDRERGDELRQLVDELQARYEDLGAYLDLTGPWPPYNFVPRESALPA